MSIENTPAVPRASATVLICRDGEDGLEVFMVKRHHQIDFASGALVFPGGKVESGDADLRIAERAVGLDASDPLFAFKVAAIREAYEESGILFARDSHSKEWIGPDKLDEWSDMRNALCKDTLDTFGFLEKSGAILAGDALTHYSHWITPEILPKRFDTHFYIGHAPALQIAGHDGEESVDSLWVRPEQLLRDAEMGKATVIFPTRCNLMLLAACNTVDDAIAECKKRVNDPVLPWIEDCGGEMMLCIREDSGYPLTREKLSF